MATPFSTSIVSWLDNKKLTFDIEGAFRFSSGPQKTLDMALSKRVRIGESKTFTIRADAINALNRPIWGQPNTNTNSTVFGRITTATGNRTITFNARVDF